MSAKLIKNAPLGKDSWFACGGTADTLFEPANLDDLIAFLKENTEPLTIVGGMANMIVRDGGVRGVTIRLGKPFADIKVDGTKITAGAGALNGSVAAAAVKAGIGGLEFLSGVPGTIGGAVRMNAGAYGTEVKDILVEVTIVDRDGTTRTLKPSDLHMTYRHTDAPEDSIFVQVTFKGIHEDYETVKNRMTAIKEKRNSTQPIREKTGGSTFANPSETLRAWQVVQQVGGHDLQIGGAAMSPMHSNFMINTGSATAADLETLGDEIIKRAAAEGITLRWEIRRIGER